MNAHQILNTKRSPNVGLMLSHRRRRWTSIEPTLGQRLVFTLNVQSFTFNLRPESNQAEQWLMMHALITPAPLAHNYPLESWCSKQIANLQQYVQGPNHSTWYASKLIRYFFLLLCTIKKLLTVLIKLILSVDMIHYGYFNLNSIFANMYTPCINIFY